MKIFKPTCLPRNPDQSYVGSGWKSWPDLLGTDSWSKSVYVTYAEAKRECSRLNIKTSREYRKAYDQNKFDVNMPSHPQKVFREQWSDWSKFLGSSNRTPKQSHKNVEWVSLKDIKKTCKNLGITSAKEYRNLHKLGKLPNNFPFSPERSYEEFTGWFDLLGKRTRFDFLDPKDRLSYEQCSETARRLGIQDSNQYKDLFDKGSLPIGMPSAPNLAYEDRWQGWKDFLSTERPTYEQFKRFCLDRKIQTSREYLVLYEQGKTPSGFTRSPRRTYMSQNFRWKDCLVKTERFWSFTESREYANKLGLKSFQEWKRYIRSNQQPIQLPKAPDHVYKNKGWLGWVDFLRASDHR